MKLAFDQFSLPRPNERDRGQNIDFSSCLIREHGCVESDHDSPGLRSIGGTRRCRHLTVRGILAATQGGIYCLDLGVVFGQTGR
jgi:hypothetical protein